MECLVNENIKNCNCSYPCDNHGICCQCLQYHRKRSEMPACYFNANEEKTYDRSIDFFIKNHR